MADVGRGGSTTRARIWIGLLALATGALLVGDPVRRTHDTLLWLNEWWPWVLLALALVNLVRSAVPTESLIGPLVLVGAAAAGLMSARGFDRHLAQDLLAPAALALTGAFLVLTATSSPRTNSWTRLLATGAAVVPAGVPGPLTVRAIFGELRADLSQLGSMPTAVAVHVTAVAGHVRLTVPQDIAVTVRTTGALLTRVAVTPPAVASGSTDEELMIHVLGICGAVSVVRG
ncbi:MULTISPECIES: hypothetical protein [unclassified Streptomyces]|uniref:hypothetical protein n=1 Tax=unclassified Streptomyces TaxID=2593676 RepID=UPI0024767BB0|nr:MULTISPECIES: hypothetical protein [unclassified Streptomyces]MDH6452407.1 hypothetical protein [Streptomyces sp. SAI-119]MDH6497037.1 hypothetical protein [Streptomyces sp. SAI-149]